MIFSGLDIIITFIAFRLLIGELCDSLYALGSDPVKSISVGFNS